MRRWIGLVMVFFLFLLPAYGAESDIWNSVDTDELERQAQDYTDMKLTPDIDLDAGLYELAMRAGEEINAILVRSTRSGGLILMIALFCALTDTLCQQAGDEVKNLPRLVGALAVTAAAMGDVGSLMELGRDTVEQLSAFNQVLIPVMTTAAAASGSVTGAASRQMVTLFCSNLLLSVMKGVLIPMVYLYVAASAGALASDNGGLTAVADFLKWAVQSILRWLLLLYTSYLGISGVIAGAADRTAVKMARFAITGMVPVVGGILSDASESLLAGAGLLRNAVGIFGTIAVMGFCLTPFIRLGIQYLLYRGASVLTAALTQSPVSALVGQIGTAVGMILAMTGTAALVTLISLVMTVAVAVS